MVAWKGVSIMAFVYAQETNEWCCWWKDVQKDFNWV